MKNGNTKKTTARRLSQSTGQHLFKWRDGFYNSSTLKVAI
jgi:hypothetical protein